MKNMVVKYNNPTFIWFNIKHKIFGVIDIYNIGVSLASSYRGRPIGRIEVVEFEKITDDFYWFTMTNGKHMGLHVGDFTQIDIEHPAVSISEIMHTYYI